MVNLCYIGVLGKTQPRLSGCELNLRLVFLNVVHKGSAALLGGDGGSYTEWERPGMFYVVHGSGKAAASEGHVSETGRKKKKTTTTRQQQERAAQVHLTQVATAAPVRLQ